MDELTFADRLKANLKLLPSTAVFWVGNIVTFVVLPLLYKIAPEQWTAWVGKLGLGEAMTGIIVAWLVKDLPTFIARVWPQPKLEVKREEVQAAAAFPKAPAFDTSKL